MMKQLLVITLLFTSLSLTAQVHVDGKNVNADSSVRYVEIMYTTYPTIFYIESVDIGTKKNVQLKITNQKGKRMRFNSPVDLLSYMEKNGWRVSRRDVAFQAGRSTSAGTLVMMLFERNQ